MKIGFIAARLGGVDGVSLEVDKWMLVLKKMGHEVLYCTGEIMNGFGYSQMTGKGYTELKKAKVIPEMSFWHPANKRISRKAFTGEDVDLKAPIERLAKKIKSELEKWIRRKKIDIIIVENASAIPMHIPLGVAIGRLVRGNDIPAILHHHDFYWERKKYLKAKGCVKRYIEEYFPFDHYLTRHVVINSPAKADLMKRKNANSIIIPNVFDYGNNNIKPDRYNKSLRSDFGIAKDDIVALAPVRIIPRKDIRTAIKIVGGLQKKVDKHVVLLVTGYWTDVGKPHMRNLLKLAKRLDVDMKLIGNRITPRRTKKDGKKYYTIWDTYPNADFVVYPSLYEGWGNALGEAIEYKKLVVIRRYHIFRCDIEKLGFELIAFNKFSKNVVNRIHNALSNPKEIKRMVEKNHKIAKKHLSFLVLEQKLKTVLDDIVIL